MTASSAPRTPAAAVLLLLFFLSATFLSPPVVQAAWNNSLVNNQLFNYQLQSVFNAATDPINVSLRCGYATPSTDTTPLGTQVCAVCCLSVCLQPPPPPRTHTQGVSVYFIDLFDNDAATVSAMVAAGLTPVCYFR